MTLQGSFMVSMITLIPTPMIRGRILESKNCYKKKPGMAHFETNNNDIT